MSIAQYKSEMRVHRTLSASTAAICDRYRLENPGIGEALRGSDLVSLRRSEKSLLNRTSRCSRSVLACKFKVVPSVEIAPFLCSNEVEYSLLLVAYKAWNG